MARKSIQTLYKAITEKRHAVVLHGETLELATPSPEDAERMRRLQLGFAEDSEDGKERGLAALAELSMTLASEAVRACLPGLASEQAKHLVSISGGERGELAATATRLCGIGRDIDAQFDDGLHDDPS